MNVVCLIDHLGPGGAQRQLCLLATLLKKQGHAPQVITYHDAPFYASLLDSQDIPLTTIPPMGSFKRLLTLRRVLRRAAPDAVIAFLRTPALIAECATWPDKPFPVIASERNCYPHEHWLWRKFRLFAHRAAGAVVTNSSTLTNAIAAEAPSLRPLLCTIPNAVDLDAYANCRAITGDDSIRIVVLAKFSEQKNPSFFVEAMADFVADHPEIAITADWYGERYFDDSGRPTARSAVYLQTCALVRTHGLQSVIRLHGPTRNVHRCLEQATALVLPSSYEGMANVLGEAMACARPVIASTSCDPDGLVLDGETGILYAPTVPADLKGALARLVALSGDERRAMGCKGRARAERLLSPERLAMAYHELLLQVTGIGVARVSP